MEAKIVTQLQKCHLAPKAFVYISYGAAEHDIFIIKVSDPKGTIEFVGDNNLKMKSGDEFFIGKQSDKKLKMKVI